MQNEYCYTGLSEQENSEEKKKRWHRHTSIKEENNNKKIYRAHTHITNHCHNQKKNTQINKMMKVGWAEKAGIENGKSLPLKEGAKKSINPEIC